MKVFLSITGIIVVFAIVAFLETPNDTHGGVANFESKDTSEVSSQVKDEHLANLSLSVEYLFEGSEEKNGYILETYRKYDIYKDDKGNIIKSVPTNEYDHLRYKVSEE